MAEQWHYSKDNQQHGPVSAARLKELAASGELAPTDLVWKNGMADWQPAAKLKGLFPNRSSVAPSSSSATAPPVPPPAVSPNVHTGSVPVEQSASTPGLGDRLRVFLGTAQEAGRLVAKQTERAKVAKVTLPAAFRALGKEIFEARRFESEFPQHFQRLDSLKSELEAIQSRAAESPSPSTFTGKAKGAAKTAKVTAQTKSVELKVASAYTDLGKQTFHSHAEASGPEAVVRPVMDALARLESLDAEIAVLSEKGSGSWITPKRLAVGGIATAAIILVIIGSSFFGGGDAAFRRELAL